MLRRANQLRERETLTESRGQSLTPLATVLQTEKDVALSPVTLCQSQRDIYRELAGFEMKLSHIFILSENG